jgi:RNA polymerase sigma factor (sigma-70 family)
VSEPSFKTTQLRVLLERMHKGDLAARDELLQAVRQRLERLARKMLGKNPRIQRWTETGDVLQGALLRLLRSLQKVPVASTREFFGLAAEQVRRELLDLARHYYGPRGLGTKHASQIAPGVQQALAQEPTDAADDPAELERWYRFHEAVAELPLEERETVGLVFYHGWTTAQVAELYQVSERTVRRRWRSACLQLQHLVGDELPRG